jgi:uncharacterized protein DUF4160
MNFNDHAPPHFHARYGNENVAIEIATLTVIAGNLAPRALGLVMEWAAKHQENCWRIGNWQWKAICPLPSSRYGRRW